MMLWLTGTSRAVCVAARPKPPEAAAPAGSPALLTAGPASGSCAGPAWITDPADADDAAVPLLHALSSRQPASRAAPLRTAVLRTVRPRTVRPRPVPLRTVPLRTVPRWTGRRAEVMRVML